MKSAIALPQIEVDHASMQDGAITELGSLQEGRVVWRVPVDHFVAMYRSGLRFFMRRRGRRVEIVLNEDCRPGGTLRLQTRDDGGTDHGLLELKRFPI